MSTCTSPARTSTGTGDAATGVKVRRPNPSLMKCSVEAATRAAETRRSSTCGPSPTVTVRLAPLRLRLPGPVIADGPTDVEVADTFPLSTNCPPAGSEIVPPIRVMSPVVSVPLGPVVTVPVSTVSVSIVSVWPLRSNRPPGLTVTGAASATWLSWVSRTVPAGPPGRPMTSGPRTATPAGWLNSSVPPATVVVPVYRLSVPAVNATVPGPTTSRLNAFPLSVIGTAIVSVSAATVVPSDESLPSVIGIADHVLLPEKSLSAPWPANPGPLIVSTSVPTLIPPPSCRVAPVLTRVPSGPSWTGCTVGNAPPVPVAVIAGRFELASVPTAVIV